MPSLLTSLVALGLLALAIPARAQQAQPSPAEAKLREGLRNTMLQLRTMQGERDQLLVDKATLENEKKDLADKLEALTKQAAENQAKSQQTITQLEARVTAKETEAAQLNASLAKWQAAQKQAAELAAKKEGERATAAARIVELDRQVADQQRKNVAMYKVGTEVLRRYEKFVLGDTIVAREPFTGIARVKFQTLAQDFRDQLTDEVIKPEAPKEAPQERATKPAQKTSKSATPAATPSPAPAKETPAKGSTKATASVSTKGPRIAEQKARP